MDAMDAAQQPLIAQASDQENINSAAAAGKRTLAAEQESIQLKASRGSHPMGPLWSQAINRETVTR